MTGVEIALIIIGIIFIFASYFVQEKLSSRDIEEINRLSEKELKIIVERQLKNAGAQVEDSIDRMIEDSKETAKRSMEKESNEKIMAINEYSNTVIESMNKTHNEILFLYNMLNDKHSELTELAASIQQFSDNMKNKESEVLQNLADAARGLEHKTQEQAVAQAPVKPAVPEPPAKKKKEQVDNIGGSHNEKILALCRQGLSDVQIARELGLGLGEVRLVIGLYKGGGSGEA